MTLEDLIEFAVKRGGSVLIEAVPRYRTQDVSILVEARMSARPGRDNLIRAELRVSPHELRLARFPVVKLTIAQLMEEFTKAADELSHEEALRKLVEGWPRD